MKRTGLALFLALSLPSAAFAGPPPEPPPPPEAPQPPVPSSAGRATAQISVTGPVTLRADVVATDLEVRAGVANQVKAELTDSQGSVRLVLHGSRVEVALERGNRWPHLPAGLDGKLRLELPPGSSVELTTASGAIAVRGLGGDVRLRTASGDVQLRDVRNVEVTAISGAVQVEGVKGEVRLRTVSGDAMVTQAAGARPLLEYGTTSGDLDWTGTCGAGCRLDVRTMSGDVKLKLAASSSFELRYLTHSGDLLEGLKLQPLDPASGAGSRHARYGKAEGSIQVQTFSGDLALKKD